MIGIAVAVLAVAVLAATAAAAAVAAMADLVNRSCCVQRALAGIAVSLSSACIKLLPRLVELFRECNGLTPQCTLREGA